MTTRRSLFGNNYTEFSKFSLQFPKFNAKHLFLVDAFLPLFCVSFIPELQNNFKKYKFT